MASSSTSRRWARRGAATSSRGWAGRSSRWPRPSSGCAGCAPTSRPVPSCWPRPTRRTRTARRCRGRSARVTTESGARRACPGAYVVTIDAEPVLYVERGGKGLVALRDPVGADGEAAEWVADALAALADEVHRGRIKRIAVERFDGESIIGSPFGALLIEAGFRQSPRKLTLTA